MQCLRCHDYTQTRPVGYPAIGWLPFSHMVFQHNGFVIRLHLWSHLILISQAKVCECECNVRIQCGSRTVRPAQSLQWWLAVIKAVLLVIANSQNLISGGLLRKNLYILHKPPLVTYNLECLKETQYKKVLNVPLFRWATSLLFEETQLQVTGYKYVELHSLFLFIYQQLHSC